MKIESGPAAVDFGGGQGGEAGASPQSSARAEPTPKDAPKDHFEFSDTLLPPNGTWAVGPTFPSSSARKKPEVAKHLLSN